MKLIKLVAVLITISSFGTTWAVTENDRNTTPEQREKLCEKYSPAFSSLLTWLETAPPPGVRQNTREEKLKVIDEAMLEEDAKQFPCVGDFFRARMKVFLDNFATADPGDDTLVWKLYNHTEIIQTKDITIAIDLFSGFEEVTLDDKSLDEIISRTDVFLVTHSHADHVDQHAMGKFLDAGRPVVVPELFWPDYPRNDELTVIRKGDLHYPGVHIVVFPSMQKTTLNNVYLILTDNGHSMMHLGDNNNFFQSGHEWFRNFKKPVNVDLLIPNIWTPDMASLLKYVRPELILSSHEHELGHPPRGRRTYEYVYGVLHTIKEPYVVPMWGEKIVLKKD